MTQSEAEWRTAHAELQTLMASFDDQMGRLQDLQLATTAELHMGRIRQALLSQEAKLLQVPSMWSNLHATVSMW